jgi:hypothetical protein
MALGLRSVLELLVLTAGTGGTADCTSDRSVSALIQLEDAFDLDMLSHHVPALAKFCEHVSLFAPSEWLIVSLRRNTANNPSAFRA